MRQMRQILMAVTVSQTLLMLPPPVMSPLPVMSQHLQGVAGKSAQSSSVLREQGYAQHEGEFIYTSQSETFQWLVSVEYPAQCQDEKVFVCTE